MPGLKEVRQRALGAFHRIDVAPVHPALQSLRRNVGQYDFIHPLHHPVGHRLAHLHPADLHHRRPQALNVLHVHRRQHINVGRQQLHHVFVTLAVEAAINIGVRQLVYQYHPRTSLQNSFQIHLMELGSLVLHDATRDGFQLRGQLYNGFASMRLDDPDDNIFAATAPSYPLAQHCIGLAHAGSIAQEQLEYALRLRGRDFLKPFFRSFEPFCHCKRVRNKFHVKSRIPS